MCGKCAYLYTMSNTHTHPGSITQQPIVQQTARVWMSYLSRTNQDRACRELCDIMEKEYNYNELLEFANREMRDNTGRQIAGVSFNEIEGRRAMASTMVTILYTIKS